ncbi:MAG TPA: hypothetical protein PKO06_21080, partial [Candidatus Ozemobacteraceae bacterium]|nr:hypothetical protein [Candidatus Ozemobacteraceae bacterium]
MLPYRSGLDEKRSPKALYERAVQIDPCVLITLRSMEHIEFELTAAAGGPKRRAFHETLTRGDRWFQSTLTLEPEGETNQYHVSDLSYDFAGVRESGKSSRTGIMVGVRVDADGNPQPLPREASTIYSFLPTSEVSGLHFFVQGHFDLLVDRERIAKNSTWNQRLFATVPEGLRLLAEHFLSAGTDDATTPELLAKKGMGFLDVLPLEDDLPDGFYRATLPQLSRLFRSYACVPGSEGSLIAPERLLIVDPGLAGFLGNRPVPWRSGEDRESGARYYAQSPHLTDRQCLVAVSLGARFFGVSELLEMLHDSCTAQTKDTAAYSDLPFMQQPSAEQVLRLYGVLCAVIEREKDGPEGAAGKQLLEKIAGIPLLYDEKCVWRKFATDRYLKPARGARRYRELFDGLLTFVHPDTDLAFEGGRSGQPVWQRSAMLFDWLGIPVVDEEWVLTFLESATSPGNPQGRKLLDRLLEDPQRVKRLMDILVDASPAQQKRAGALPVFPRLGGGFNAVAS